MQLPAPAGDWSSDASRHVVLMGARVRDERRDQDRESPLVDERLGNIDQSGTSMRDVHEFQIRVWQNWSCVVGLIIAQDAKVVLVYPVVIESVLSDKLETYDWGPRCSLG